MHHLLTWLTDHELWLLWIYGLPLLVSSNIPLWLLAASLATVPVFWIARRVTRGAFSRRTPLDLPILILVIMGFVGGLLSIDRSDGIRTYLELLGEFALFYGLVNSLTNHPSGTLFTNQDQNPQLPSPRRRGEDVSSRNTLEAFNSGMRRDDTSGGEVILRQGIMLLLALGLGMALLGLFGMRLESKFLPPTLLQLVPLDLLRLTPQGFSPNIVAGAIAPLLPVWWAWGVSRLGRQRWVWLLLSLVPLGILILTQSRGAWIGLALSLLVLAASYRPRPVAMLVPALAVVGLALYVVAPATLHELILGGDVTVTASGRFELWDRAVYMLQDFPFTGIGLASFNEVLHTLYPPFLFTEDTVLPQAHNLFLQTGLDYGVPGLVAFVALVTVVICAGVAAMARLRGTTMGIWAAGLTAGYVVYLGHGLTDAVTFSTKPAVIVWFIAALIVALYQTMSTPGTVIPTANDQPTS